MRSERRGVGLLRCGVSSGSCAFQLLREAETWALALTLKLTHPHISRMLSLLSFPTVLLTSSLRLGEQTARRDASCADDDSTGAAQSELQSSIQEGGGGERGLVTWETGFESIYIHRTKKKRKTTISQHFCHHSVCRTGGSESTEGAMDSGTKTETRSGTPARAQESASAQHNADVMPLHEGWLLPQLLFTYKCS